MKKLARLLLSLPLSFFCRVEIAQQSLSLEGIITDDPRATVRLCGTTTISLIP
jgi:hypothetical protein